MNTKLGALAGIVLLQIILVAFLWLRSDEASNNERRLLEFDPAAVASVLIADTTRQITLNRLDHPSDAAALSNTAFEQWQVGEYRADEQKISNMLDKLAALDAPWPVASSGSSATRFETTESLFQRRIELRDEAGEVIAELYLGTSPGFQRVHARRAGSGEVYSVGLANHEFGVNADEWVDKGLLALEQTPTKIALQYADVGSDDPNRRPRVLHRTSEGWVIDGVAADQSAAATYANRFTTLQMQGIAEPGSDTGAPLASLTVTMGAGDGVQASRTEHNVTFKIQRIGDAGDYFVSREGMAGQFRLATYIAEQLLMTDVDFLPAPEAETDAAAGGSDEQQNALNEAIESNDTTSLEGAQTR